MKNILIIGIGRCGKTTLSHMLKKELVKYNLVHSDTIKWGIIRGQGLEKEMQSNIEKQKEFEHSERFQKILLEFFLSSIRNDIYQDGNILESGQLEPSIVDSLIDRNNTLVISLGHGNSNEEDIIHLCRTHDTEKDWTYNISEDKLKSHALVWHEKNKILKDECDKYNIKYYDTSSNRVEILKEALQYILTNI